MKLLTKSEQRRIDELTEQMRKCRLCPSMEFSRIYPGIYRPGQKYFFVGAAPWNLAGPEEGLMVGKASANFDKFIEKAGILRSECYTTNAVVHIPQDPFGKSRQPGLEDIKRCSYYLAEQIEAMNPTIVIALGSVALNALHEVYPHQLFSVSRSIRKPHKWCDRILFVCTHPSPNAVSFRHETDQIEDYRAIKNYYDTFIKEH